MGPIGHFAVGLAAKPVAPKVPLGVLFLATVILDVLAIAFGLGLGTENCFQHVSPCVRSRRLSCGGVR